MQPRAIETRYKGYRFRSRLEARWAVFFDALGVSWEYEPEGFELPGGVRYLPDFRLNNVHKRTIYAEVKASKQTDDGKALAFSRLHHPYTGFPIVLLLDGPPDEQDYAAYQNGSHFIHAYFFDAGGTTRLGRRGDKELDRRKDGMLGDKVREAVYAARGARFEHGESGARA